MKLFFEVLVCVLLVILCVVGIIGIIAVNNGFTIVEQIKVWFDIVSESPPIVDPNRQIAF